MSSALPCSAGCRQVAGIPRDRSRTQRARHARARRVARRCGRCGSACTPAMSIMCTAARPTTKAYAYGGGESSSNVPCAHTHLREKDVGDSIVVVAAAFNAPVEEALQRWKCLGALPAGCGAAAGKLSQWCMKSSLERCGRRRVKRRGADQSGGRKDRRGPHTAHGFDVFEV